jgi:hypothetical protein
MARKQRKVYGHIKCTDCGTLTDINRQQDESDNTADHGRFYWNCKNNRVCLAHHRFSPGIADVKDVPGYIPLSEPKPETVAPGHNSEKSEKQEIAPSDNEKEGGGNDWFSSF